MLGWSRVQIADKRCPASLHACETDLPVGAAAVSKMLGHSSIPITSDTDVPTLFSQGLADAALGQDLERIDSESAGHEGGPRGTRTHNPRIKSPLLCQLS